MARYFHAEGIGTIRALTDELGNVTDRYTLEAFGTLISHDGDDPNAYLFAGEVLDPNSGFYYNRARWLDPNVGKFASVDPFGGSSTDPISLHRYLYAALDPLAQVDPTGRESLVSLNVASMVLSALNTISLVYTAARLGWGGGSIVNGLLIDETMSLEEAAEEAWKIGETAAITYLFNFGGVKIASSLIRKLGNLGLLRVFSAAKINGRLAEHYIGSAYGMIRNGAFTTARYLGAHIPDFANASVIREVKNVSRLFWRGRVARQLGTFASDAVASGRQFFIHVRPGTQVDPRVISELEQIFGQGARGTAWDIVADIPDVLRVVR